jgi:transcriptional regulator with XRE-family HTH domain
MAGELFAKTLSSARRNHFGPSGRSFAGRLGYSPSAYRMWETGQCLPRPDHLHDVLNALAKAGASPLELNQLLCLWLAAHHLEFFSERSEYGAG